MREIGVMGWWLDDMWATRHMQWAEADEESRKNVRGDPNADGACLLRLPAPIHAPPTFLLIERLEQLSSTGPFSL